MDLKATFNFLFKNQPIPELTPTQLQVVLQHEKQHAYYLFVAAIALGAVLAAWWSPFKTVFDSYAGFLLAALGMALGVNVAHKALNNNAVTGATTEDDTTLTAPEKEK